MNCFSEKRRLFSALVLAAALVSARPVFALSPHDSVVATRRRNHAIAIRMRNRGRSLAPTSSFINLALFYRRNKLYRRAAEVYLFGLIRRPDDIRLLRGIAETYCDLGWFQQARPYVERLEELSPGSPINSTLLQSIRRDDLASAKAESSTTSTAAATPATGGKCGSSETGGTNDTDGTGKALSRSQKLRALSLMKALAAAVRSYNLNHRRAKMTEFNLKPLLDEGLLPADIPLGPYKDKIRLASGVMEIEGIGTEKSLEKELERYRSDMARYDGLLARQDYFEALDMAKDLLDRYPDDENLLFSRLLPLLRTRQGKKAVELTEELVSRFPGKPRPLFELIQLLYRLGDFQRTKNAIGLIRKRFPGTHWVKMAEEIGRLIDREVDFDLLSNLIRARSELLDKVEKRRENAKKQSDKGQKNGSASK